MVIVPYAERSAPHLPADRCARPCHALAASDKGFTLVVNVEVVGGAARVRTSSLAGEHPVNTVQRDLQADCDSIAEIEASATRIERDHPSAFDQPLRLLQLAGVVHTQADALDVRELRVLPIDHRPVGWTRRDSVAAVVTTSRRWTGEKQRNRQPRPSTHARIVPALALLCPSPQGGETDVVEHWEWSRDLSRASAAGEHDRVVTMVARAPIESLQAAGSTLLEAIAADAPGTEAAADDLIGRLRERSWVGDAELMEELDVALGRAASDLLSTGISLVDLGEALQGPAGTDRAIVDLADNQVWTAEAIENSIDCGLDVPGEPDGSVLLEVVPEPHGYRDMHAFINTVDDDRLAERLEDAVRGKKSYRRFRDTLERSPKESSRWQAFTDDRQLGRARAWLAEAGYRSSTPA